MAQSTKNGVLLNASTATGNVTLVLPQVPSVILLFVTTSGTVSYNIELRDGTGSFIPVRTLTASAVVKLAVPATELGINVTANSGSITVSYRSVVLDTIPNVAIEVFTQGDVVPQSIITLNTENFPETPKSLGQGQLTTTSATLYTVPSGIHTKIRSMFFVNNDTVDRTFTLSINGPASTAANRIIDAVTLVADGGFGEYDGEIDLDPTDTIRGLGSVANVITYTITGVEQTLT